MKHPQHILAFDKARFGLGDLGPLVTMSPKSFFEAAYASLFIGRREELEKDERFGQLLPYIVLRRRSADGLPTLFQYQRTKQVGESRLGGKFSIGVGGHVDLCDVRIDNNSVVDVVATIALAIARELNEEIGFDWNGAVRLSYDDVRSGKEGFEFEPNPLVPKFCGVINDLSDEVGRVHLGCVFAIDVPEGFEPVCLEDELVTVGMRDMHDIERGDISMIEELENWSSLLIKDPSFILFPR